MGILEIGREQMRQSMGGSIPLGDWGSFDLSSTAKSWVQDTTSDYTPDWLSDLLFPGKSQAVSMQPKINPMLIGGVVIGTAALITLVVIANKKPKRRAPRKRKK